MAKSLAAPRDLKHNTFLMSDMAAKDFKLTLEVKLVDDVGNSGVQFRTEPLDGFNEVRGYQADIGPGWWGKLYEENGRGSAVERVGREVPQEGRVEQVRDRSHRRPHPHLAQRPTRASIWRTRKAHARDVCVATPFRRADGSAVPEHQVGSEVVRSKIVDRYGILGTPAAICTLRRRAKAALPALCNRCLFS